MYQGRDVYNLFFVLFLLMGPDDRVSFLLTLDCPEHPLDSCSSGESQSLSSSLHGSWTDVGRNVGVFMEWVLKSPESHPVSPS